MEKDKLGKEVVEYCKQYEGTDKYDVAMLAIAKGYALGEEDLEASVKEHALGFAKELFSIEITKTETLGREIEYHPVEFNLMLGELEQNGEELFDNYLRKLRE